MAVWLAVVIVTAYIYLMIKGRHRQSGWFFIGILSILAMFVARAIAAANLRNVATVEEASAFVEVFLGVAFLALVFCLPGKNVDQNVSDEVKNVLGTAFHKAAENAEKSETKEDSTS